MQNEIICLNVGGKLFQTTLHTLLIDKNSMLAAMFDKDRGHTNLCLKDGSYFIDRDPLYFRPILNFLRTNIVSIDSNISCSGVLEEAKYFNIVPMQIAIFDGYKSDRFACDFTQKQIQYLHELKQQIIRENQNDIILSNEDIVLSPSSNVASAKDYIEPNHIRAEITRKELLQIIATGGINTRLRLSGICFSYQDLSGIDLGNCNLILSDFSFCKLKSTTFFKSTMSKCCFRNCNLQLANCNSANLVGADLRNCDLRGAHLCHADLMASNLEGIIFNKRTQWNGAVLRNAKGLSKEQRELIKQQGGDI